MSEQTMMNMMSELPMGKMAVMLALCLIGLLAFAITLIVLIVKAIGKKKLKGTVIALLVFALMIGAGIFLGYQMMPEVLSTYSGQLKAEGFSAYSGSGDRLVFSSVDKDGNAVDSSIFKENKITLVNRWEPWCGPCKAEMPDLEALYEKYAADGFGIVGVYSDEEELQTVLDELGITYPIIKTTEDFSFLHLGMSVPCSLFVDSEGNILEIPEEQRTSSINGHKTNDSQIGEAFDRSVLEGYRDADVWESMIKGFLGK